MQEISHRISRKLVLTHSYGGVWTWRYDSSVESSGTNR